MRNGRRNNKYRQNRNMIEMIGVPGWMRFGRSPGFASGGRGIGPCATYLQKTGQMDKFIEDYTDGNPSAKYWQQAFQNFSEENPEFEKEMLTNRIDDLEAELKDLKQKLKQLR